METNTLAYLAGLFDGEGTFSIQVSIRSHNGRDNILINPRMTMTLKYGPEVLKELQSAFGGQIYLYPDAQRWNLSKREPLIHAAATLIPYLRIKHEVAVRFIEALEAFPKTRMAHGSGNRSWTPEMVERVASIALTLNPYRKTKKEPKWAHIAAKAIS
jgi:hypothetical protein